MSSVPDNAVDVLRAVWDGTDAAELDKPHSHQKSCRNMKHVSFDGFAEPGTDVKSAWRERLQREGKLNTSGGTIRDLILGADTSH
ncbi:MAG TPA: hypothetical protein VFX16_37095 [Pseudonocardiaceae bacterium]|nr:hypothetical protein [Pseudonocardiaceae bacterium]